MSELSREPSLEKDFTTVTSPHLFIPELFQHSENFNLHWENDRDWVFCNFSHLAYKQAKPLNENMHKLKPDKTIFYENDGAQAFLSIWNDKAILSFRGTQLTEHIESEDDTGRVITVDNKLYEDFPTAWKHKDVQDFHGHELPLLFENPGDVGNTKIIDSAKVLVKSLRYWKFRIFYKLLPLNPFFLINDLISDFNFFRTKLDHHKKVKVHRGFLEETNKLWPRIQRDIKQYVRNRPLWATGHSLGGAMATITGTRHQFESVTTFGEPRVGKNIGKAFISKEHIRFVNGDDPVTKVPPVIFGTYKHHGTLNKVDDSHRNFIYDHSIIYYAENILKV